MWELNVAHFIRLNNEITVSLDIFGLHRFSENALGQLHRFDLHILQNKYIAKIFLISWFGLLSHSDAH